MNNDKFIVAVALEKTSLHFDRLFDYGVPLQLQNYAKPGCRVSVPFGASNTFRQGMIFACKQHADYDRVKMIDAVLDVKPVLSQEMLLVAKRLVQSCFCTYYDAIRAILPSGMNYRMQTSYGVASSELFDKSTLSVQQLKILESLQAAKRQNQIDATVAFYLQTEHCGEVEDLLARGVLFKKNTPKRRVGDKIVSMVRLSDDFAQCDLAKLSAKQKKVVNFLQEVGPAAVKEICYFCGVTPVVIKNLVARDLLAAYEKEVYRNPYQDATPTQTLADISLTQQQEEVLTNLLEQYHTQKPSVALLHGVTGSGKTLVFVRLIAKMLEEGKQSILLVPEIALTPQLLKTFQSIFGQRVAVLHSGLTMGEQLDEYKRIERGQAQIVLGTRSAVFAPVSQLGCIIMDEEGEGSYKSSDMAPRYHARDVAKFRCLQQEAMLLLASATPCVESYYAAKQGKYQLYELPARYHDAPLPEVQMVDLRQEPLSLVSGISEVLAEELLATLKKKEQVILLLNRRGYHSAAICTDCGWVANCPQCTAAMTYHQSNGLLMCHYCGHSQSVIKRCPVCGGTQILFDGYGTQQVEEQMQSQFADARILRMDADTTFSRAALEQKIEQFAKGEYDILVGTQMVAKGLNFPNVTLVGVIASDSMLHSSDFRSRERVFSMLTQVVGRGGRGIKPGQAVLQTYQPEDPVMQQAAMQDYQAFYQNEITEREAFFYPPFCDICVIGFRGSVEWEVQKAAETFLQMLKDAAMQQQPRLPLIVLGVSKPYIYKINNRFRLRIIMKCKNNVSFRTFIWTLLRQFLEKKSMAKMQIFVDINGEID